MEFKAEEKERTRKLEEMIDGVTDKLKEQNEKLEE